MKGLASTDYTPTYVDAQRRRKAQETNDEAGGDEAKDNETGDEDFDMSLGEAEHRLDYEYFLNQLEQTCPITHDVHFDLDESNSQRSFYKQGMLTADRYSTGI